MQIQLDGASMRFLRALLRHNDRGVCPTGNALRAEFMSRNSRTPGFYDFYLVEGLMEVVGEPEPGRDIVRLRDHYRLTDAGRYAAEYGVYEKEIGAPAKLTPLAQQALDTISAVRAAAHKPTKKS